MFEPYQIVCLECLTSRLYAEVVQWVEHRQICWVRPLALLEGAFNHDRWGEADVPNQYYDLRDDSDLLLPQVLFRRALDIEVLPLITQLYSPATGNIDARTGYKGHQKFQQFIHQVWQTFPDVFCS